jgi:hypothetical protein
VVQVVRSIGAALVALVWLVLSLPVILWSAVTAAVGIAGTSRRDLRQEIPGPSAYDRVA